jgi:4-amino-4-deoxy-L-arabinose transferase-like glycosyltransferase
MSLSVPARRVASVAAILVAATLLRSLWLTADPPTQHPVGVVWHDEGAWAHNARNRALFGVWRTDEWNPVFVAPVFVALEYGAFRVAGVGTWQARVVPVASGLAALALLMAGLRALGGWRVALVGGWLLATDFTWVMWNRAALMESTMTALIVVAWAACALAARRPVWGLVAGVATMLAFFTKASAAFFAAALVADALATLAVAHLPRLRERLGVAPPSLEVVRGARFALAGLAVAGGAIVVFFVWPHWSEYQFYNWQMSVERKPSYDLVSLKHRASWLPIVQDFFMRMWLVLAAAAIATAGLLARWRDARPAERLLVLWVFLGLLELTVHDAGNERRYVMFIPALIALAALIVGSGARFLPEGLATAGWRSRLAGLPFVLALGYLVIGSGVRLAFLDDVQAGVGQFKGAVRVSAAATVLGAIVLLIFWSRIVGWLQARRVSAGVAVALVAASVAWNLGQYARWAAARTELNYQASAAVGRLLPPGTLVHGKLANGLSLENQIRPIFVGRGFGNYDDRFDRNDVRYILTYDLPWEGYESQPGLIAEILGRYPNRRTIATFEVDETPGVDRAALIDKRPGAPAAAASGPQRARD